MTLEDPRWDDESRAWALALEHYERLICPSCGLPASVCQDPENEDRFEADLPIRCHATTALTVAQERFDDENTIAANALLWEQPTLAERRKRQGHQQHD